MDDVITIGAIELRFLRRGHDTGGALDLFEMSLKPDGRMPVPHHHTAWEETVYGLTGVITWTVGGKPIAVGPGESLFIPRGVIHGFENLSGSIATCLNVLTPGVLGPAYFREMAAAVASSAPPEAMRAIMERHGLVPAPPVLR